MAATNKRGVFSLETVLERQDSNNWVKIPEVFRYVNEVPGNPVGTDYGYFIGGTLYPLTPTSTVRRLDFSNDTTNMSAKGPLTAGNSYHSSMSSTTHGYTIYSNSKIDRIDYANDTATAVPVGSCANAKGSQPTAFASNDYGYFAGGYINPSYISYVDRVDFSSDTSTTSPKGPLSVPKGYGSSSGNQNYGYSAAGSVPPNAFTSAVDRVDYSNDTATASPKGPLTRTTGCIGAGNADYGYHAGGWDPAQSQPFSTKNDRIDYSNDTATALLKGTLCCSDGKQSMGATSNTAYGWWAGGYGANTRCQRLDFSNDTAAMVHRSDMPTNTIKYLSATSSRENAHSTTSFIVPATRTENYPAGFPFGYTSGGIDDSPATISSVERIDFSSSTLTPLLKGPLPVAKYSHAGTGNLTHGYHGGGYTSSNSSTVDRIDYANDSPTASPKGNLAFAGSNSTNAAVGNVSYGYWNEGQASPSTRVSRVDFSNDSAVASPKGNLVTGGLRSSATGTQSYGYFCNSSSSNSNPSTTTSTSERIDYSNDTATALQRANSSFDKYGRAAAGNSSYGYWFGGTPHDFSEPWSTDVDRLDYSSDTTTMSPKGNLYTIATRNAATSDASHGYIMGRGMCPATNI